jgi:hypothetical protein
LPPRKFFLPKPNRYPNSAGRRPSKQGCRACIPLFSEAGQYVHDNELGWVRPRRGFGWSGWFWHAGRLWRPFCRVGRVFESHRSGWWDSKTRPTLQRLGKTLAALQKGLVGLEDSSHLTAPGQNFGGPSEGAGGTRRLVPPYSAWAKLWRPFRSGWWDSKTRPTLQRYSAWAKLWRPFSRSPN